MEQNSVINLILMRLLMMIITILVSISMVIFQCGLKRHGKGFCHKDDNRFHGDDADDIVDDDISVWAHKTLSKIGRT